MGKDMSFEEKVTLAIRLAIEAEEAKRKEGQRVEVRVYDTLIDGQRNMKVDAICVDINEGESNTTIVDIDLDKRHIFESKNKESDDA
tara:strand:+ start:40 stop:300 length:261 start_codon:yes stop_codon:yes gene_type:complete